MSAQKEKVLIIVESPSKINTIKKYLPKDKDYFILASIGHIVDLSYKFKHRLGVDLENNFNTSFVINKDKIDVMQSIFDAATVADKIILATDPDREGEAIAYHIADRLKGFRKEIKRVEFPELTKIGIPTGLKKEREIDFNLANAAIARRVLDRIVGFMGSPFVIKRLGRGCSAGRVQSVALKLIVEREKEIKNFKPEEYWNIKVELCKAKDSFFVSLHNKDNISNKKDAIFIKEELEKSKYVVKNIIAKEKKRNPYPPLNTAKLQMVASSRLGISSSNTMSIAQDLYQAGKITYIRTDSLRVSPEAIDMVRNWISKKHSNSLPKEPNNYKNKSSAQDGHEAIRPTDVNIEPENNPKTDDEKIYKLIWEYFVASQMKPAVYDTTSITIETNKKRVLKTNGRILKEAGWLSLLGVEEDDDNETDSLLPSLFVKDVLNIGEKGVLADQKFTQPPPRFKNHTLIKELESKGIGRPSTYATIMKTICETRNFVESKNKSLIPTQIGKNIVKLLDDHFTFMEYNYTSKLENKLDLISGGKCTYLETMEDFFKYFKTELDKAYTKTKIETDYVCTKCDSKMVLQRSALGYFLGCGKYPECRNIMSCEVVDGIITLAPDKNKRYASDNIKCPICTSKMLIRSGKYGDFYSCEDYPNCRGSRKLPYGKKCPDCGNELYRTIFRKGPVLCCMGYPDCKHVEYLEENNFKENHKKIIKDIKRNTKTIKRV